MIQKQDFLNIATGQSRKPGPPYDRNRVSNFNAIDVANEIFVSRNQGEGGGFVFDQGVIINGENSWQLNHRSGTAAPLAAVAAGLLFVLRGPDEVFGVAFAAVLALGIAVLAATLAGIYGLRGIYFAIMQEANIPVGATGAAVGIISVVGYTPDIFMSPLMGYLLDTFPGALGHRYVFGLLLFFGALGLLAAVLFRLVTKD